MKRKHFDHFNIAGFTYYDGVLAFNKLKIGTQLKLKPEPKNRYDEDAVAIHYKKYKLGFIPRDCNKAFSAILSAGQNIFETRVQQLDPKAHPEQQVQVVVFVRKGKEKKDELIVEELVQGN